MKKLVGLLAALAAVLLVTVDRGQATSTTTSRVLYVDPDNGNDSGYHGLDGAADAILTPFKTIAAAMDSVSVRGAIYLRGGVYNATNQTNAGMLNLSFDGSGNDSVLIAGYPGEEPIIDYGQTVFSASDDGWDIFESNGTATIMRNITFRNAQIATGTRSLLSITSKNSVFDSLRFENVGATGGNNFNAMSIQAGAAGSVTVKNSTFYDDMSDDTSYFVFVQGDATPLMDIVTFDNCTFNRRSDLTREQGASGGIKSIRTDSLIVRSSTFYNAGMCDDDCFDDGITAQPNRALSLEDTDRVLVEDCVFESDLFEASQDDNNFSMHNRDAITVTTFSGATSDTLRVYRCSIKGYGHGINGDGVTSADIQHLYTEDTIDDGVVFNVNAAGANSVTYSVIVRAGDDALQTDVSSTTFNHNTIIDAYEMAIAIEDDAGGSSVTNNLIYGGIRRPTGSFGGAFINESDSDGDSIAVTWGYNLYQNDVYENFEFFIYRAGAPRWYRYDDWVGLRDANAATGDPGFLNPTDLDSWQYGGTRYAPSSMGPAAGAANDGTDIGALHAWKHSNSDIPITADVVRATLGGRRAEFHTLVFTGSTDGTPQTIYEGWKIGSIYVKVAKPESTGVTLRIKESGRTLADSDSIVIGDEPLFLPVSTDSLWFAIPDRVIDGTEGGVTVVTYPE